MAARAACLATIALALLAPQATAAATRPPPDGAAISRLAAAGTPIEITGGVIHGMVRLPLHVLAPVTLAHVTFLGPVLARSTSFDHVVSFSGSHWERGADFSGSTFNGPTMFAGLQTRGTVRFDNATFRSSALFGGARFGGATTFAGAEFDGTSRFRLATFGSLADFDSASFESGTDFASATFKGPATFDAANFRDVADFSSGEFKRTASFAAARFSSFADFIGRTFGQKSGTSASFFDARFDGGASFLDAEFDAMVRFDLAEATSDMVFDGAVLDGDASFSTVRFLGDTTLSQTTVAKFLNFDQAALTRLDLDGTKFQAASSVALPKAQGTTGHLDELRLDPNDVTHVGVGSESSTRADREHALALVEDAARRGGDTSAANRAYLMRRTLLRHDKPLVPRVADYMLFWGFAGYLVAPLHQVVTLVILLLLFALARVARPRWNPKARRWTYVGALRRSWAALWRLDVRQGTAAASIEATAYKVVVLVLLLNLANVWPPIHDLVKGVLL